MRGISGMGAKLFSSEGGLLFRDNQLYLIRRVGGRTDD
jgi:hypothetical protein